MAETSLHGAVHRKYSGDRPRSAPPLSRRDLISDLPDTVIHNIFSFLPLRDVVKTSVLSKSWRHTWTTTTDLVFDEYFEAPPGSPLGFQSMVDSVLSQCTSPTVKKFHLTDFKYDHTDRPKIDLWLQFAVRRCVEDLRLWLSNRSPFFYVLPEFLYCLSRLVRLEVGMCCFSLGVGVNIRWPCLKVLSIQDAKLSDDLLGRIFRGCPVLECLKLSRCWGVNNIIIDSLYLKKLVLISLGIDSAYVEKLCAPYLLSLRVKGGNHVGFRLGGMSSLVEAELDFSVESWDSNPKGCDLLKHLLEKLRGVPTITTGGWCLQVLSLLEMDGVPSPLSKCQNLILHAPVSQWDLPGIAYMLRSAHCLEKLVIHLTWFPMFELDQESKERLNFDEEDFLCSRKGNFECLVKHLKRVEVVGFEAYSCESKHLLTLIKFLLGDALVLEKLIIKAKFPTQDGQKHLQATVPPELLGAIQNVLSYQRASKNAEIILDYYFE